jgi:hypothetical protein
MNANDFEAIRRGLASFDASANHTASGEGRPKTNEIYAPEHHAGALDPNSMIVLGARGSGKSFWAGVLANEDTRRVAAQAYPQLGLEKITVSLGFSGQLNDGSISRATIDHQVPRGEENTRGLLLWRCVILRAMESAIDQKALTPSIGSMMERYDDPEKWEIDCADAIRRLADAGSKLVVVFDALDAIATEWDRLRDLGCALLELAWSMRSYSAVRLKLFLRIDLFRIFGWHFVEWPKLFSGATKLNWSGTDLYGLLFAKLCAAEHKECQVAFSRLLAAENIPSVLDSQKSLRNWPLATESAIQARIFIRLAGAYMGNDRKRGNTYYWPLNHLADGHGEVSPRTFLTLMIQAARHPPYLSDKALSAEGIRRALRFASKARVDELAIEYKWIKRALAPLAGIHMPCSELDIIERWNITKTAEAIEVAAARLDFFGPSISEFSDLRYFPLTSAFRQIGVLSIRKDLRYDMPDLFRVAAKLLKKGGVAPD